MNILVWKLLRRHISVGQLAGFFLANLFGMTVVLLGIQFYNDILPVFTQGDSFMQKDYIIATKKVSTLGSLSGKDNTFSAEETDALKQQPFTRRADAFTPSLFKVSAAMGIRQAGISLSTEMFFESVPDRYVDARLDQWVWDAESCTIPIIIPRNYLNLYNFGFAQSRNLPKLSEGLIGLLQMDIILSGNGRREQYKGIIAGFSNRLNTILVPQAFMDWANRTFAPGQEARPSRLIVEVNNPADEAIATYFAKQGYETEGNGLDAGKTTHFLRLSVGIVMAVGLFICLLSLYILMLSIFLLLQKNAVKLETLLLTGYSPAQVALPYHILTTTLSLLVWLLSMGIVTLIKGYYTTAVQTLFPQMESGTILPSLLAGIILFAVVSGLNIIAIRRKTAAIWNGL